MEENASVERRREYDESKRTVKQLVKEKNKRMNNDDAVLMAKSEEELRRIVDAFEEVCVRRKLRVHAGKSKVLLCERQGNSGCVVRIGGQALEVVDNFTYLGSKLFKRGKCRDEVENSDTG